MAHTECESQFRQRVPSARRERLRAPSGSRISATQPTENYAITFPHRRLSGARALMRGKGLIKSVLQNVSDASLGQKQREEWARQHCGSVYVCVCACRRWCLFHPSHRLHWS